ncbi:hypothetical protein Nepgr_029174 [Nepenthes gracilis]|uniref:Uncharacterized protein n=1 Tax=Nepenthes gracilis TaxID=150966 RepID=A0AAD3Y5A4_NEPGR|nr:hypothetical protein Nepgr_029174 [Nepenthes gracilis]
MAVVEEVPCMEVPTPELSDTSGMPTPPPGFEVPLLYHVQPLRFLPLLIGIGAKGSPDSSYQGDPSHREGPFYPKVPLH